jgi:tetratricopeptide (TPR) repeat protein
MTLSGEEESPELAAALFAMGVLKDDVGETESSREFHERALAMRIRLFGESHADVAQSLNALGVTLFYGMGNIDSARVVWEQALDIRRELLGPSHRDIAESLSNLGAAFGELYYQSGRTDEDLYLFDLAEDYFTEALEMTRRERGELHPFYASNLHNYGLTLMDRGVLQEAENKFEEAIEKRTLIYGRVNNYTANSINMMGRVRQQQGRLEEAAPYFQESFDIHVQLQGPRSATVGIDHTILGGLDRDLGNLEQAVGHFLEGFSILQEALGPENVRTVRAARDLGKILEDLSRFQESERYLQVAVNAIGDEGSSNAMQVSDLISLARVQMLNGRRQAAEGHLAAAEAWLAENPDEELSAQIEAIRGS